ncbi:O-antigen ligase family protein [Sphaerisporangium sp. TRM90804]|uniref:O-antigen ligase family protein n=1 Tax=Sphaerisporangium sp. TRM90804 TaxID=3031113 RepID=UPI0024480E84|nr:O-antigen ligase family protein [Sphaerisporangium sp. TRM90804]MDH2428939.1 O-antigen ligase family protein [Sphaerisporangium sp. TRM90804]
MVKARHRRAIIAWWPILLPIGLILASEYKLRSRAGDQSIGGSVDATILLEIGVYGVVALYMYRKFGLRPPRRRAPYVLLLAWGFACYSTLSALWTLYPTFALVRGTQMLTVAAVCHVIATRAGIADLRRLAHVFILLVLGSVAIGVAMPFPRTPQTVDRFNWLYVHPVSAGIFLGVAVLLVAGFALPGGLPRKWPLPAYLAAGVVLSGALVATGTRGAAGGCVAGLVVMLLLARGARGRAEFLMVAVPSATVIGLGFSEQIIAFATRGETVEQLESLNARTDLWTLAFDAVAAQPLFGNGLSSARGLFLEEIGLGGGHNAFVNVLVEGGAFGFILFCTLMLVIITTLLGLTRTRETRPEAAMLIGMMVFFIVDGFTTEMVAAPANVASVWLYLVVAWTYLLARKPAEAKARLVDGRLSRAT